MSMLEAFKINLDTEFDAEAFLAARQAAIDAAIQRNDVEFLQAVAAQDKANLQLLAEFKQQIADELTNCNKIKNYVTI